MKKLILILPLALVLYVMVGCQDKDAMAGSEKMKDINGDWQLLTDIPTPRFNAGICEYENKIYVFGGTIGDTGFGADATASVEMYSPDTDSWSSKRDMLSPRTHLDEKSSESPCCSILRRHRKPDICSRRIN